MQIYGKWRKHKEKRGMDEERERKKEREGIKEEIIKWGKSRWKSIRKMKNEWKVTRENRIKMRKWGNQENKNMKLKERKTEKW